MAYVDTWNNVSLSGNSVLELGCGNGDDESTHYLSENFQRVVALDYNEDNVNANKAQGLSGVRYMIDNCLTADFGEAEFDTIVCKDDALLLSDSDVGVLVERFKKWLSPDGSLYFYRDGNNIGVPRGLSEYRALVGGFYRLEVVEPGLVLCKPNKPSEDQRVACDTTGVDSSHWDAFNVEKWRDAMFTTKTFFRELYVDTTEFVAEACRELGGPENVTLVEVGCGTGETTLSLVDEAAMTIGVDFNANFIEYCRSNVTAEQEGRVAFLEGDAQELHALLHRETPEHMEGRKKVVICVGNTLGIIPDGIKGKIYQQMAEVAGPDGLILIVYWNGNQFLNAVQNFYGKNPKLCGPFTSECIDLETNSLTTPQGYHTHWTDPEEAAVVLRELGLEQVSISEKGNGVLVKARAPRSLFTL